MPIIVQKYGGTSVGSVERIQAVADRVVRAREDGNDVVVVVSAMGHTTDELLAMAARDRDRARPARARHAAHGRRAHRDVAARHRDQRARMPGRELHGLAGGHHDRHAARLGQDRRDPAQAHPRGARGRQRRGARGLPGAQHEPVRDHHAGPRGAPTSRRWRWPRRSGPSVCEIYTDVAGVFTTDPRIEPAARKLDVVSYDEMLELAAAGAHVLQSRSVEYARRTGVRLHVRSSFEDEPGHLGPGGGGADGRRADLGGGARRRRGEGHARARARPARASRPRCSRRSPTRRSSIDMIVQNVSHAGATDLSFTAPRADLPRVHGRHGARS